MCIILNTKDNKLLLDNGVELIQYKGNIVVPDTCEGIIIKDYYSPVSKVYEVLRNLGIAKNSYSVREVNVINKWLEV